MTFSYDVLEQLSDKYGMDIDDMLELLGEPDDNDQWTFDDLNKDGIPDILEKLITSPTETNDSQGGAFG